MQLQGKEKTWLYTETMVVVYYPESNSTRILNHWDIFSKGRIGRICAISWISLGRAQTTSNLSSAIQPKSTCNMDNRGVFLVILQRSQLKQFRFNMGIHDWGRWEWNLLKLPPGSDTVASAHISLVRACLTSWWLRSITLQFSWKERGQNMVTRLWLPHIFCVIKNQADLENLEIAYFKPTLIVWSPWCVGSLYFAELPHSWRSHLHASGHLWDANRLVRGVSSTDRGGRKWKGTWHPR
jgi:hypothetical protein